MRLLAPEACFAGFLLLGLFQVLPLPPDLHRILSPEAARIFDRGLPPGEEGRWRTLSVYPFATKVEILRLAALAMVFTVFARGLRRSAEARFAVAGFTALGTAAALAAMADQALGGALLSYYPREARFEDRLAGVLVNPNHFAGLMTLTALAGFGLYFAIAGSDAPEEEASLRSIAARGIQEGANRGPAVAVLTAILACTAALFLTGSRLGTFSFVVGLTVFAALFARGRGAGRALAGLTAVTVLVLAVNALVALDPVLERWTVFFGGRETAEGRIRAWEAVFAMGQKFLVLGSGLGTFEHVFPAYQPAALGGTWDKAHNDFLQLFSDGGLLGSLLAIGLVGSWMRVVGKGALSGPLRRRGLAAGCLAAVSALLVHATGDFNFQIPGNAYLMAALMGVGYGVSGGGQGGAPDPRSGRISL